MMRILILIILIWILYQVIKRIIRSANAKSAQFETREQLEEKIVQCAYCGCHVPESESQMKNGQIVCNNPDCARQ